MNKVFYVSMVKNEIDILPHLYNHLLDEDIDGFLVADNLSTDGTREFLSDFASNKNVFIVDDPEIAYYQSVKMNRLILQAVELGATHIIAADGDEFWYSVDRNTTLGEVIRTMQCDVAIAPVYDMVPSHELCDDPVEQIVFREPLIKALPSVAFKWIPGAEVTMGNHDVYQSSNRADDLIAIRHFQYRSYNQFMRKLRDGKKAYDATEFDHGVGAHWRIGGSLTDEELKFKWNSFVNQPNLVYDPTPIKNRERLI